jgi:hypothetical protein
MQLSSITYLFANVWTREEKNYTTVPQDAFFVNILPKFPNISLTRAASEHNKVRT